MQFGASSAIWVSPFSNHTLGLIKKVRYLGFDFIEVRIENPNILDPSLTREAINEVGLEAMVCTAFDPGRDVSAEDGNIRKKGIDYIKTCIDFAEIIGSPSVIGPMYSVICEKPLSSSIERNQQLDWIAEHLREIADYAEERGIRLAIKPLNRYETKLVNTVEQGLELVERIGCDNVGLCLDTYHMNIEEKNPMMAIRLAGKRIFHFHASENDRGKLGAGHISWRDIFFALKDIGFDGPVGVQSFYGMEKEINGSGGSSPFPRSVTPVQDSFVKNGLDFLINELWLSSPAID